MGPCVRDGSCVKCYYCFRVPGFRVYTIHVLFVQRVMLCLWKKHCDCTARVKYILLNNEMILPFRLSTMLCSDGRLLENFHMFMLESERSEHTCIYMTYSTKPQGAEV